MASCRKLSLHKPRQGKNQQPSNPNKPQKWKFMDALQHNSREKLSDKAKERIDPQRTHLNVSLVENTTSATQSAEFERLKQGVHMMKRRDLSIAFEWIFTLPEELYGSSDVEQRHFFEVVKSALESRYNQRALSAWCHYDEKTPHIHLIFPAITDDKKRGGKKFCCKEIINLPEYTNIYDCVQAALDAAKIEAKVRTGVTQNQGGNRNYYREREHERQLKLNFKINKEKERGIEHEIAR